MTSKTDVKESYKRMSVSLGWFATGASMVLGACYIYSILQGIF